ncbi:hypothetical protein KKI24_18985 [bacterium]|nr:hypothetical protein [bacterium]
MADYSSILLIIKAVIGVMVVGAVTIFVLRPLFKNLNISENRLGDSRQLPGRRFEEELEIPTSKQTDVSQKTIIKKALEDPNKTTQLVRNWLKEKK